MSRSARERTTVLFPLLMPTALYSYCTVRVPHCTLLVLSTVLYEYACHMCSYDYVLVLRMMLKLRQGAGTPRSYTRSCDTYYCVRRWYSNTVPVLCEYSIFIPSPTPYVPQVQKVRTQMSNPPNRERDKVRPGVRPTSLASRGGVGKSLSPLHRKYNAKLAEVVLLRMPE